MKNDLFHLTESGMMARLGDYLCGNEQGQPFSFQCDGAGTFGKPQINGHTTTRTLVWQDSTGNLEVTARMGYDPEANIFYRRDTLKNTGKKKLVLRRWLASFPFPSGKYEVLSQQSMWAHENGESFWTPLHSGAIQLFSREGRWAEGCTPYAALRDAYAEHALAFFVCPVGDWTIRFSARSCNGTIPDMTVEAGMSDDRFVLELAPGEEWAAPEIFVQVLPGREAWSGTAQLHGFLNRRFPARPDHFPLVYNTWLDRMEIIDVPRLEKQLDAAKRCGCEVFVVDYGWYEDFHKFCRVDDWDECTDRAFYGKMKEFSDKVRKAGLGFGFWVELEFFYEKSKVVKKHPDWFFKATAHEGLVCPKIWLPEVENYLVNSLAKTIERYKAVYVKNDMNHSQGYEPARLYRYQSGLFRVLARLKKMCPQVTFENCSSGSNRMAPGGMMEAFDNHFVSDNACPLENIRMFQNAMLRFTPGRIYHWYVGMQILGAKNDLPEYMHKVVYQPQAATWFRYQVEDLDFGLLANMTGQVGYSCDLASFSPENQEKIAHYNEFYKKFRNSLIRAEGRLLTPPEPYDTARGWASYQLTDPMTDTHFVYVFHAICDGDSARVFHPKALKDGVKYKVTEYFPEETRKSVALFGEQITADGLRVEFSLDQQALFRGKLILIQPV